MILKLTTLSNTLTIIESLLYVDYQRETAELLDFSLNNLENKYQVDLSGGLEKAYIASPDAISSFVSNLETALSKISLLSSNSIFEHKSYINLGDVRYLGYDKTQLLTALKYLTVEHTAQETSNIINSLTTAVDKINHCDIKRLIILLLILDRLDVPEGVSIIAQYLYLGGIL